MSDPSKEHSGEDLPIVFKAQIAATDGGIDHLRELIGLHGNELLEPDERGYTLLHAACRGKSLETIQWLIDLGLDVNAIDHAGGSPLFEAINAQNHNGAQLLRKNGAKLHVPRHVKMVSYMQFGIAVVFLVVMIFVFIAGNLTVGRSLVLLFCLGVVVLGIHEGVKGLKGEQTVANS